MQALMLAAGMGKRLGKYTKDVTKCMVPVNGKPLIEYAIEALVKNNIKKMVIVVGYKSQVLIDFINSRFNDEQLKGMKIEFINNPIYDKTNNIYSLFLAKKVLCEDDTILLESDIIFKPEIIEKLIESENQNLAVVSKYENWMDGTCTFMDDGNNITEVENDNCYKTVNIYRFSKEFSANYYVPFLETYQKTFGKNEYYEQVIKVLSFFSSTKLKGLSVSSDDWYEIDDPEDLAIAENIFAKGKEKLKLLQNRYGGYWRFPQLKDYCYLVNPYFPPQKMVDEIEEKMSKLLTQYPSGAEQLSILAGSIFNVLPNNIVVGNGAAELISSLAENITGKAAVPFPTFNEYPERLRHCEIIPIKTDSNDFSYTVEDIIKTVCREKVSTVLLINPDNPSGNFIESEDILRLLTELKEMKVRLIFDESFIDFADKTRRYTLLNQKIIEQYPNLVVIKSISKSFGVPGLRLGIAASSDTECIRQIKKANSIWNINSTAEYFLQIYKKYSKVYLSACDLIEQERTRFIKALSEIEKIKPFPSQANFVLCKLEGKIRSDELAVKLLDEDKILIKDLTGKKCFEKPCWIRLAIRDRNDNDALIEAMKKHIE